MGIKANKLTLIAGYRDGIEVGLHCDIVAVCYYRKIYLNYNNYYNCTADSTIIAHCSTMRGRIKGPDSSIYSILRTVGIYRTSGEFIEPEAVWKRIRTYALPSLLRPFFVLQTS